MPYKDPQVRKQKQKEYQKQYYEKNKEYYLGKSRERKRELRKWYKNWKLQLECARCGEDHYSCLDFHHKSEKSFSIHGGASAGFSKERILEEASKCIVLCANCHRKEHNP